MAAVISGWHAVTLLLWERFRLFCVNYSKLSGRVVEIVTHHFFCILYFILLFIFACKHGW